MIVLTKRERLLPVLREAVLPIAAVAAGLVILAVGLALAGYDPAAGLGALVRGAFGSWYAFASGTLVRAVPLVLLGLAVAIAMTGGALNIGGEGQFYAGAIAATWVGLQVTTLSPVVAIPLVMLAGAAAGLLWIVVPVVLKVRAGVLEVISTLLLTFVAEAFVSLMVQGPLQEAAGIAPQSDPIARVAQLPTWPGTRLHLGFLVALVATAVAWWVVTRTAWGFALRASGAGPRAAATVGGIDPVRMGATALLVSGALAGLAGAIEVQGVSYALYQNLSPGYGFTAIAVALLARGSLPGVLLSGLLFGALETGAGGMQREAGIPSVVVYVAEAVIIAVVLVATRERKAA
jgi:simple sugar transport system permease protein